MPQFYVTVERVSSWNLVIDGENEAEAQEKAAGWTDVVGPDYYDRPEIVHCSEVKRVPNEF